MGLSINYAARAKHGGNERRALPLALQSDVSPMILLQSSQPTTVYHIEQSFTQCHRLTAARWSVMGGLL